MKFIRTAQKEPLVNPKFKIFKFNNRPKPADKSRITIFSCLSEFGCEVIGCLWCLPRLATEHPGDYKIAVGWYGREYLYRHLVDEFWELQPEYQFLRDFCKAFHHESRNLKKLEETLKGYGNLVTAQSFGRVVIGHRCRHCGHIWSEGAKGISAGVQTSDCPRCKSRDFEQSLFSDIPYYRDKFTPIPKPSAAKCDEAKQIVKPNSIGLFARGRKTYGRNLQPEFYVKLIDLLESMNYNIVWLGEKQSTLPCPVPHIEDLSRKTEARDLELTLAIVGQCKFTIQFWTASTRLSALAGVPFLLFETPMQIWGEGQEGLRLSLLKDMAPKKLAICHFRSVYNDHDGALKIAERCVYDMEAANYEDVIGLVENPALVKHMRYQSRSRIADD